MSAAVTQETFTPTRAQAILASCNLNNRTIRWNRVSSYADSMKAGLWMDTGESLKFDIEGRLIDGQHRLLACVEADVPITMLVVRGLPTEAFKVIDSGLGRKTSDVVQAMGTSNAVNVASSVSLLLAWRADCLRDNSKRTKIIKRTDIVRFVEDHFEIISEAVSKASNRARKTWRINSAAICALGIELYLADRREKFDEFYDSLVSGENLSNGDPRLTLIKWAGQAPRTAEVSSDHLWACVRAWNAWSQGEPLKQIKAWYTPMPKLHIPHIPGR